MPILHYLSRYLRARGTKGLRAGLSHLAVTLSLLLILPLAASAYTIVMRSGRRVEIPRNFRLTRTTLSYEAAPGISITLQLSNIDVAATERLNGEPPGGFLRRLSEQQSADSPGEISTRAGTAARRASRTVTNRDLEASRRARAESEAAYEKRRLELGLPSLAEVRRRQQEEAERLREESRRMEAENAQAESYWRDRATALRTEIAALEAEISYVRSRLNALPHGSPLAGSYTLFNTVAPLSSRGPRLMRRPFGAIPPRLFMPGNVRPPGAFGGPVGVGATRGQLLSRAAPASVTARGRGPALESGFGAGTGPITGAGLFVPPFGLYPAYPSYDSSYERTMLVTRLNELESAHTGLLARWRLLEEEARRAGAQPGWLRPF